MERWKNLGDEAYLEEVGYWEHAFGGYIMFQDSSICFLPSWLQ